MLTSHGWVAPMRSATRRARCKTGPKVFFYPHQLRPSTVPSLMGYATGHVIQYSGQSEVGLLCQFLVNVCSQLVYKIKASQITLGALRGREADHVPALNQPCRKLQLGAGQSGGKWIAWKVVRYSVTSCGFFTFGICGLEWLVHGLFQDERWSNPSIHRALNCAVCEPIVLRNKHVPQTVTSNT
jgi:hypothetical protein